MRQKIKGFFLSLLSQDMERQAFQVEVFSIIMVILLLAFAWSMWNYRFDLTTRGPSGSTVVIKSNIFEVLLSKRGD